MRCKARVVFCFYCMTVKIGTLGKRPLLAQSRPSAKRPRLQSSTSGERLGDGSKGITVPTQATVDRDAIRIFEAHPGLGRLRLRGPRGGQDEFVLAAIARNLRRLGSLVARPLPPQALCI